MYCFVNFAHIYAFFIFCCVFQLHDHALGFVLRCFNNAIGFYRKLARLVLVLIGIALLGLGWPVGRVNRG